VHQTTGDLFAGFFIVELLTRALQIRVMAFGPAASAGKISKAHLLPTSSSALRDGQARL
jgi:hypothetical protein